MTPSGDRSVTTCAFGRTLSGLEGAVALDGREREGPPKPMRRPTVAFIAWFGPRGAASIVFALLVLEEGGLRNEELILTTAFVTVGLSVLAHGATAAALAARYGSWLESRSPQELSALESGGEGEIRWRLQHDTGAS